MATIYVSYRSTEEGFVRAVVDELKGRHQIRIDYELPAGADFRSHQLEWLSTSDVFLVFVSQGTRQSDFQNSEIGAAQFCQTYVDGKLLIPALIDPVDPPRPLAHLDCLRLTHRDPRAAAEQIEREIAERRPRIRLFVSHAHLDADVAAKLVDVITGNLDVPKGELRCTSVPGYQLDLGAMAPDVLRRELASAECIVALLTPNSIGNDWVLFELGAAWANTKVSIPLLAGGPQDSDIPGPLRGAAGGQLGEPGTLDRMLDQLEHKLGWPARLGAQPMSKRHELVAYMKARGLARDSAEGDLKASFAAKRARIGQKQGQLLDHVTSRIGAREYLPFDEVKQKFPYDANELYYRLEQLRLLGFLSRRDLGSSDGGPVFGWGPSAKYRQEIGV